MELRWVVLAIVARIAVAGPVNWKLVADPIEDGDQCSTKCVDSSKFGYTTGRTYKFQYNADISSTIAGAMDKESNLHLSATVRLEALAPCELALTLSDVALKESNPDNTHRREHIDGASEFKRQLQGNPLRFSFQDGEIEAVCPEGSEVAWVLNIKKGIISALQNNMPNLRENARVQETDVTGRCRVDYTAVADEGDLLRVQKSKDLLSCTDRTAFTSAFQSSPYMSNSKIQSLPIVKSSYSCDQVIHVAGRLVSSHCTERHLLRPFSNQKSGAVTETKQILRFIEMVNGVSTRKGAVSRREELLYDHTLSDIEKAENSRQVESRLMELCEASKTDINPSVPLKFQQTIETLRTLDGTQLKKLHKDTVTGKFCDKAKSFVRDALPVVGTASAVELITSLIKSEALSKPETEILLTSLGFIQEPTRDMLPLIKSLVTTALPHRKAFLAVSSLVHGYCTLNKDCQEHKEVKDIVNVFKKNLGYNCAGTGDSRYKVLMSLKSIGNAGHVSDIMDTLMRCIKNNRQDMEIRVAAAASMRRLTCSDELNDLLEVITDADVDSELRIASYLALMKCPTTGRLARIRQMLEYEPINQVGSFVWTHLTNLLESANPIKREIADIIYDTQLNKTFDLDKRKFSRNIEWSMFSEMLNLGVNFDSNLIWSSQSFIPRSGAVNLKFDLFGRELNLFEIGMRGEGFEGVLEKLLFPKESGKNKHRTRRAAKKAALENQIEKKYKLPKASESKGSVYLKLFDNEIRYDDFKDIDLSKGKDRFNYLEFLIKLAKDHKIDVTKNVPFLETTFKVPTISGMPLKLLIKGAASIELKVNGKMDMRNVWKAPRSLDIDGEIYPSGAIVIDGEMGVDATLARTGVIMASTFHTSTGVKGKIQLKEGKDLAVQISLPKDKTEVVDVSSKFYLMHRGDLKEQQMISTSRVDKSACVGQKLIKPLGLDLCGSMAYTNAFKLEGAPWFPLTAPVSAKVTLHKKDTHSDYVFAARYTQIKEKINGKSNFKRNWHISFNTPGSRVNRHLFFDAHLDEAKKSLDVDVKTPWKQFKAEGQIEDRFDLRKVHASIKLDNKNEYSATAQMGINDKKNKMAYTPLIEVRMPNSKPYVLDGSFMMQKNKQIQASVSITNIFKEDLSFTGHVNRVISGETLTFNTDLKAKSSIVKIDLNNTLNVYSKSGKDWTTETHLSYTFPGKDEQKLQVKSKYRDVSGRYGNKLEVQSSIVTSQFPQANVEFDGSLQYSKNSVHGTIEFGYGKDFNDAANRFKSELKGNFYPDKTKSHINGQFNVIYPKKGIHYVVECENLISSEAFKSSFSLQKGGRDYVDYIAELKRESVKPLNIGAEISVNYPGRRWQYKHSLVETIANHYQHDLNLQSNINQAVRISSSVVNAEYKQIQAKIEIPNMDPISGVIRGQLSQYTASASGEVTFKKQTYKAVGNVRYAKWTMCHATAELSSPGKSLKGDLHISRRASNFFTTKFEGEMKAGGKVERIVTINGDVTTGKTSANVNGKVQWGPYRVVNVRGDFKFEENGWWSSSRKWSAEVRTSSRIPQFNGLGFKVGHVHADKDLSFDVNAVWGKDKQVVGNINIEKKNGWKSIVSTASLTTPMQVLTVVRSSFEYDISKDAASSKLVVGWNKKQLVVDTGVKKGWTDQSQMFNGHFDLNSPLTKFGFKTGFTSNSKKTYAEISSTLPNSKKAAIILDVNHDYKKKWTFTSEGKFEVAIPVATWEKNSVEWKHVNSPKSVNINTKILFDSQITTLDIKGDLKKSYKVVGSGSIKFKSPLAPYKSIIIYGRHMHHTRHWKNVITTASVKYDSNVIKADSKINYQHKQELYSKLEISSPFNSMKKFSKDIRFVKKGAKYLVHNEMKWGANKKMTVEGDLTYKGMHNVDGEIRLLSPFENYERMLLSFNNGKEKNVWKSGGKLSYVKGKTYSVNSEIGLNKVKQLKLTVNSPHKTFKQLNVEGSFQGQLRSFQTSAKIACEPHFKDIGMKTSFQGQLADDIVGKVEVKTPFDNRRNTGVTLSHKREGKTYDSSINLKYSDANQVTIGSQLVYNKWFDNSGSIDLLLSPEKKYKLAHQFSYKQNNLLASLTASTPYENYEQNSVKVVYKGPANDVTALLDVKCKSENILVSVKHEGKISKGNFKNSMSVSRNTKQVFVSEFDSTLKKQFTFIGKLVAPRVNTNAEIHFNPQTMQYTSSGKLVLDEKNEYTSNVEMTRENNVCRMTVKLTTPIKDYSLISLSVIHKGKLQNFENDMELLYGINKKITTHVKHTMDKTSATSEAKFTSPHTDDFTLYMNGQGIGKDMTVKNKWVYGEKQVIFNFDYHIKPKDVTGNIVFSSPFKYVEDIKVSLKHSGSDKNLKTEAELQYATNKKITTTVEFSLRGTNAAGSIAVKNPWRNIDLIVKHNGKPTDFRNEISVQYGSAKKIESLVEFSLKGKNLVTHIEVSSPFKNMKKTVLDIKHHANPSSCTTEVGLQYDEGKRINFIAEFSHNGKNLITHIQVSSPFKNMKRTVLDIKHHANPSSCKTEVGLQYDEGKTISYISEFSKTGKIVNGNIKFSSPFKNFENVALIVKHKFDDSKLKTEAGLQYGKDKSIDTVVEMSMSGDGIRGNIGVSTPFKNFEDIKLNINHSGKLSNFKTTVTFEYGDKKIASTTEFSFNKKDVTGKLTFSSPFKKLETLELNLIHVTKPTDFRTEIGFQHNKETRVSGIMQISHSDSVVAGNIELRSTIPGYEDVKLSLNHRGNKATDFKTNVGLEYAQGKKISGTVEFVVINKNVKANFVVTSPWKVLSNLGISFKHDGPLNDFKSELEINCDPLSTISFFAEHRRSSDGIKVDLGCSAPIKIMENIRATFELSRPTRYDIRSSGVLQYRKKQLSYTSAIKWESEKMNVLLTVVTPFDVIKSTTVSFDYSARPVTINTEIKLDHSGKRFTIGGGFVFNGAQNIHVSGKLETPMEKLKIVTFSFDHKGKLKGFTCESNVEVNGERISTGLEVDYIDGYKGKLSLSSTLEKIKSVILSVEQTGDIEDCSSTLSADYSGKVISIQGSHKFISSKNNERRRATVTLVTPFDALKDAKFEMLQIVQKDKVTGDYAGNFNNHKIDFDYVYIRKAKRTATLTVKEPRPMVFTASGTVKDGNVDLDGTINWLTSNPDSNIRLLIKHNVKEGGRSIQLKAIHPLRTVGLNTDYSLTDGAFKHTMAIQWGKASGQNMDYSIEMSGSKKRIQNIYDAKIQFNTAIRNGLVKAKHVMAGRRYSTDLEVQWDPDVDATKALKLSVDITCQKVKHSIVTLMEHPYLSQPIKFEVEINTDHKNKQYTGKSALSGTGDSVQMDWKLAITKNRHSATYNVDAHVKHPRSKLDVQLKSALHSSKAVKTASMETIYLMSNNEKKTLSTKAEFRKNEVKVEMNTPVKTLVIKGSKPKTDDENAKLFVLSAECEHGKQVKAVFDINTSEQQFDVKVYYSPENPEDMMHVYGRFPTRSNIEIEATHVTSGSRHREGLVSVRLDSHRLLHTKISWNPKMAAKIRKITQDKYEKVEKQWKQLKDSVNAEMSSKMVSLSEAVKPVHEAIEKAMEPFKKDLMEFRRSARYAYKTNQFYIQDIHLYMKEKLHWLSTGIEELRENWEKKCAAMAERRKQMMADLKSFAVRMNANMEETRRQMAQLNAKLNEKMTEGWTKFVDFMKKFNVNVYAKVGKRLEQLQTLSVKARSKLDQFQAELYRKVQDWVDSIRTHPGVQRFVGQVMAVPSSDLFLPIKSFHGATMATLKQHSEDLATVYNDYVQTAKTAVKEQAQAFVENEYSKYMKNVAADAYDQGKWAYEFYEIEETLVKYYKELMIKGPSYIKDTTYDLLDNYFKINETKIIKYDIENGEIEFQVYLPVPVHSLNNFPTLYVHKRYMRLASLFSKTLPRDYWHLWDTFYKYKPVTMDIQTWIPPFSAHATLYGSKFYKTFDGRYFAFSAECTYVLARDFRDGDFSVLVEYSKGKGKNADLDKSIIVISDGVQIALSSSYKVTVDGRRTELPYLNKESSVTRIGDVITINNKRGLTVECDLEDDRCTTTISGWYFGRTAGLFGTYDYEPYTDFLASDGLRANHLDTFAQSWSLGRCRASNVVAKGDIDETSPRIRKWIELFRSNLSPYRMCFKQVNPEPFMKMGMNELARGNNNKPRPGDEAHICQSSAFYVDECQKAGVPVRLRTECVKCSNPLTGKKSMFEGDSVTLEKQSKPRADIVFVVESGKCNKQLVKKMKGAFLKLNRALALQKLKSAHFALVSYGGDGVHGVAHSHTLNGDLFNSIQKLIGGMPSLTFSHDAPKADALQALNFAASMPFRAGASKTIVLIPCSECHTETISYPSMHQTLTTRDIRLHVMLHKLIGIKSKSPKTSHVYGVDRLGVFTDKSHKDKALKGDRELRPYVDVPKDMCAVLAMDMDGSVFSAKHMMELRYAQQKRFYDIFARLVAKKANPSECQRCECTYGGQTVCKRCSPLSPFHLKHTLPAIFTQNSTKYGNKIVKLNFKDVNTKEMKKIKRHNKRSKKSKKH